MPIFAVLGSVIAACGIVAIHAIYGGFVLTVLWTWFVVPTFHLPQLTLVPAIGLAIVVGYLTHQTDRGRLNEKMEWQVEMRKALSSALAKPSVALLFGWIVHFFM